jgi:hypothetical protein
MEQRVPSSIVRAVADSITENLGEKSLRLLFKQSGLDRYYAEGQLPPDDDTPSATRDEFANLFTVAFSIFGDRGIKPILLRAGRQGLHLFRQHNRTLAALAGAAFKVLPTDPKIKLVLSRSAKAAEEAFYSPHRTGDMPGGYWVEIDSSPYCHGITADHGVCYIPVGFYGEALKWATGGDYEVTEPLCRAKGDTHCRFELRAKSR